MGQVAKFYFRKSEVTIQQIGETNEHWKCSKKNRRKEKDPKRFYLECLGCMILNRNKPSL